MEYFEQRYRFEKLGTSARIVAMAAAHHRFNYIHPFVDGNGRVSRLMSHAMAWQAGIAAHGLWSISRGLARGLADASEYKRMMDQADSPRRGDLDGRGNLSLAALVDFVSWFCRVALDQVTFMANLFDLEGLEDRLRSYVQQTLGLDEGASILPVEVLRRGELARGEAPHVLGRPERTSRMVLGKLVEAELFTSPSVWRAAQRDVAAEPRLSRANIGGEDFAQPFEDRADTAFMLRRIVLLSLLAAPVARAQALRP
jgi:Fic family protein